VDKLSFMTFMCPQWTLAEVLAGAKRHGYAGVEPRVKSGHAHGIEVEASAADRKRIRAMFADSGVAISCIATSVTFGKGLPETRQANLDEARRYLDLGAEIGAPALRVFCGHPPEGWTRDLTVTAVADQLAQLAPQAEAAGVTLCLETHDYFRAGEWVGKTVARVNSPAVLANWDVQHPYNEGEHPAATARWLAGRVGHTHCHDFRPGEGLGLCEIGQGISPLRHFLLLLQEQGYQGYLSAEYWEELGPPEEALRKYAEGMRGLLATL